MKANQFILGLLVGAVAAHLWHWKDWKKNKSAANVKITEAIITEESKKYPDPLLKEYDIVMPSDQISAKVRRKAKEISADRRAINTDKIKSPLYI